MERGKGKGSREKKKWDGRRRDGDMGAKEELKEGEKTKEVERGG